MTGRTVPSSDGIIAEIFLSRKANARRSVHSPQHYFIITLIISDRRGWRDTWGKWPLARNPDRIWWNRNTRLNLSWPQPLAPWITSVLTPFISIKSLLGASWITNIIHKIRSIQLALLRILFSLVSSITWSVFTFSDHFIFSILLQHHISKLVKYLRPNFLSVQVSEPDKTVLQT